MDANAAIRLLQLAKPCNPLLKASLRHMPIQIQSAHSADAPVLARLVEQYWHVEGIPGFDCSRIEGLLRELLSNAERGVCLVAEDEHAPRG